MVFRTLNRPYVALLRAAVVMALLAIPSHAAAQIYTWQDANGSLIVSNVPQGTNLGIPSVRSSGIRHGQGHTIRCTRRSRSFDNLIEEHATRNGVRQDLVRAVIQVESAFNPRAISNKGAMGLMQLMPATARQFGVSNASIPSRTSGAVSRT